MDWYGPQASENVERRHLSKSQRAALVSQARQKWSATDQSERPSQRQLAEAAGVKGHTTIAQADVVLHENPTLFDSMMAGAMTVQAVGLGTR